MGSVNELYRELKQKTPLEYMKFFPDKPETIKIFAAFHIAKIKNPITNQFNKVVQALVYHIEEGKYKILTTSSLELIKIFADVETAFENLKEDKKADFYFCEGDVVKVIQKKTFAVKGVKTSYVVQKIRNEPMSEKDEEMKGLFLDIASKENKQFSDFDLQF